MSDISRESLISSGLKFLTDPSLRESSFSKKIAFLEEKGLSVKEISVLLGHFSNNDTFGHNIGGAVGWITESLLPKIGVLLCGAAAYYLTADKDLLDGEEITATSSSSVSEKESADKMENAGLIGLGMDIPPQWAMEILESIAVIKQDIALLNKNNISDMKPSIVLESTELQFNDRLRLLALSIVAFVVNNICVVDNAVEASVSSEGSILGEALLSKTNKDRSNIVQIALSAYSMYCVKLREALDALHRSGSSAPSTTGVVLFARYRKIHCQNGTYSKAFGPVNLKRNERVNSFLSCNGIVTPENESIWSVIGYQLKEKEEKFGVADKVNHHSNNASDQCFEFTLYDPSNTSDNKLTVEQCIKLFTLAVEVVGKVNGYLTEMREAGDVSISNFTSKLKELCCKKECVDQVSPNKNEPHRSGDSEVNLEMESVNQEVVAPILSFDQIFQGASKKV